MATTQMVDESKEIKRKKNRKMKIKENSKRKVKNKRETKAEMMAQIFGIYCRIPTVVVFWNIQKVVRIPTVSRDDTI